SGLGTGHGTGSRRSRSPQPLLRFSKRWKSNPPNHAKLPIMAQSPCPREDLLSGHLFLFLNKRRDRIKILHWDADGLVIWYKRLEAGSFEIPGTTESGGVELRPAQLALILSGIDLQSARQRKRFQRAG